MPLGEGLVIALSRMRRIAAVDPEVPCAWVEPGVLNLDLSLAVRHLGLHYAPDPSSQAACSASRSSPVPITCALMPISRQTPASRDHRSAPTTRA